jgi:hypothetical protein
MDAQNIRRWLGIDAVLVVAFFVIAFIAEDRNDTVASLCWWGFMVTLAALIAIAIAWLVLRSRDQRTA